MPLKFGKVTGYFLCNHNKLTTLKGSPEYVGGDFTCKCNVLTSLLGAPKHVEGYFDCTSNLLSNLIGSPNYVGGDIHCKRNRLTSIIGLKTEIGGVLSTTDTFEIIYNIFKNHLEYINNFYDYNIISNIHAFKPTLNMKRFEKFIDLYDLNELSEDQLIELKKNYNII